jgi:OOP family OmpA-OmpF porin
MRLRKSLVAAALLALPVAAKAQPISGPYVSLGAGLDFLQPERLKDKSVPNAFGNNTLSFDQPGWAGQASVGYGLGPMGPGGLRLELEGDYFGASLAGGHPFAGTVPGASGSQADYGFMANAIYDFDLGWSFFPYVGVGVGWQGFDANGMKLTSGGETLSIRGTSGSFAYQGILGISFPVESVPGLAFTAEYRLMDAVGSFGARGDLSPPTMPPIAQQKFSVNRVLAQFALVGVRYAFNAAPPPPPPAPAPAPAPAAVPAPAPARSYLVFFDWDRADLTDRARQIIAEAAEASKKVQYTRIEVNGYTDRSGTPQYNLKLSLRRARAVEAELVRDGVPQNVIEIHGYGEANPLVPTAPGVREPQNRRVEIILKS